MIRWLLQLTLALCLASAAKAAPLIFIADLNGRYGSTEYSARVDKAITAIIAMQPEAVIIAGDMIAGQVSPPLPEEKLEAMWASFDRVVYQPLKEANITVLPVPGNHDASAYSAYALERRAYERYWESRTPAGASDDSHFPWFYSVLLPHGRFVGLDVTTPGTLSKEQRSFLANHRELAATAGESPLIVTHLPQYPVGVGRERDIFSSDPRPLPGEIWIAGHHHAFFMGTTPDGGLQLSLPPLGGNLRNWLNTPVHGPFGFVSLTPDHKISLHASPDFSVRKKPMGPESIGDLNRSSKIEARAIPVD